jgi:hypothetical protein
VRLFVSNIVPILLILKSDRPYPKGLAPRREKGLSARTASYAIAPKLKTISDVIALWQTRLLITQELKK